MSKILVLVTDYPDNNGKVTLMYVHTRNKYYVEHGLDVTVLNFGTDKSYLIDNISVITLKEYIKNKREYDILVSHAPNIRNHYFFLKKYGDNFSKFVFFFHGHEVLKINKTYSKPYDYIKKSYINTLVQDCYDEFKLFVWRKYFLNVKDKSKFIFVSKWMYEQFLKWTKIPCDLLLNHCEITYNCIGQEFEKFSFNDLSEKDIDFLTIRNNLDGSKYCIDFINKLAVSNPEMRFLVVGKGEFFTHYNKAPNIIWLDRTMSHKEILQCMEKSRCALMPTRTDAQGLMMCEMASTGMPLITSDIPVCHEIFKGFNNVKLISNDLCDISLNDLLLNLEKNLPYKNNDKYFSFKTSQKEVDILRRL